MKRTFTYLVIFLSLIGICNLSVSAADKKRKTDDGIEYRVSDTYIETYNSADLDQVAKEAYRRGYEDILIKEHIQRTDENNMTTDSVNVTCSHKDDEGRFSVSREYLFFYNDMLGDYSYGDAGMASTYNSVDFTGLNDTYWHWKNYESIKSIYYSFFNQEFDSLYGDYREKGISIDEHCKNLGIDVFARFDNMESIKIDNLNLEFYTNESIGDIYFSIEGKTYKKPLYLSTSATKIQLRSGSMHGKTVNNYSTWSIVINGRLKDNDDSYHTDFIMTIDDQLYDLNDFKDLNGTVLLCPETNKSVIDQLESGNSSEVNSLSEPNEDFADTQNNSKIPLKESYIFEWDDGYSYMMLSDDDKSVTFAEIYYVFEDDEISRNYLPKSISNDQIILEDTNGQLLYINVIDDNTISVENPTDDTFVGTYTYIDFNSVG